MTHATGQLEGKHVVVLGGTSGIGFATAAAAAGEGAKVTVASSRQSSVDRALAQLPSTATGRALDLADAATVRAFFDELGEFDHLVFTAGEPLALMPLDTLDVEAAHGLATRANVVYYGARSCLNQDLQDALARVELSPPELFLDRYPHELSGGQRQRVAIAAALVLEPALLVADEPVSMLDVSIRIGVLNLMSELREREGVSFLYITHDIASARYIADRVLVMYAGHLVEEGPTEDLLQRPKHPYTQLLLSAVPDPRAELGVADKTDVGEPPKVIDPGEGCRFRARCPYAIARCEIRTLAIDTAAPSPMSHEILNSNPYTYLDDAPLEERRARAVSLRRTDPDLAGGLGALDPAVDHSESE